MSDPVARLNTALQGRYAIESDLGHGGMATVYLAKDPHIVPLFDSGQADGFLFYVMPLVEGESLSVSRRSAVSACRPRR